MVLHPSRDTRGAIPTITSTVEESKEDRDEQMVPESVILVLEPRAEQMALWTPDKKGRKNPRSGIELSQVSNRDEELPVLNQSHSDEKEESDEKQENDEKKESKEELGRVLEKKRIASLLRGIILFDVEWVVVSKQWRNLYVMDSFPGKAYKCPVPGCWPSAPDKWRDDHPKCCCCLDTPECCPIYAPECITCCVQTPRRFTIFRITLFLSMLLTLMWSWCRWIISFGVVVWAKNWFIYITHLGLFMQVWYLGVASIVVYTHGKSKGADWRESLPCSVHLVQILKGIALPLSFTGTVLFWAFVVPAYLGGSAPKLVGAAAGEHRQFGSPINVGDFELNPINIFVQGGAFLVMALDSCYRPKSSPYPTWPPCSAWCCCALETLSRWRYKRFCCVPKQGCAVGCCFTSYCPTRGLLALAGQSWRELEDLSYSELEDLSFPDSSDESDVPSCIIWQCCKDCCKVKFTPSSCKFWCGVYFSPVLLFSIVYVVFTILHFLAGGTNHLDEPFVYPFLDWSKPLPSAAVSAGLLFGFVPLVNLLFVGYHRWGGEDTSIDDRINGMLSQKLRFVKVEDKKIFLSGDVDFIYRRIGVGSEEGLSLELAPPEVQGDKEFVMEILTRDWRALEFASEKLRGDKEVVMEAVKQDGYALMYASKELRGDKEVVIWAGAAVCIKRISW